MAVDDERKKQLEDILSAIVWASISADRNIRHDIYKSAAIGGIIIAGAKGIGMFLDEKQTGDH